MPRYLTPGKVCLLLLVDLYIADELPSSSKLDVLSFIASQINPLIDHDNGSIDTRLKLANSDFSVFAKTLSQWQSVVPGRSLYDILLQRIWRLGDLDSLHSLFEQLGELVIPPEAESQELTVPKISRSSPLGQYIRRCVVEFTRLQFADTQALWNAFATYRQPSYQAWATRNPEAAQSQSSALPPWALPATSTSSTSNLISADDTSTLLNFSIYQLQKLGARVPAPVKSTLSTWLSDQTDSSSAAESLQHFLYFFEHWRSGQYTIALESLHRYFDYSLARSTSSGQENMKVYYQYALLHLSVLHADFEAWGESVDAMEECIATARENQDTACLNFALSWLMYLRQAHPDDDSTSFQNLSRVVGSGSGGQRDEISFLKGKAREGRVWSLLSSTLLEEAKADMYSAGSSVKAFEHILQASYLDVQHDLRTLMPAATLFHGASLDRLGQSALSDQLYSSIRTLHTQHCPLNDSVRSSCRVAYNLAQGGQYNTAMDILTSVEEEAKGVLKSQQRAQAFKALVLLKKNIRKNDLEAAAHYLEYLHPIRSFGDPELQFEIFLLDIDLLIKQEEHATALQKANSHIATLKHKAGADIAQRLHLLVLKARIFAAGNQSLKGFSITLRAAAMAQRLSLISVLTEAVSALGVILVDLGEFEEAREVVEAALPSALENRDGNVRAALFECLTEAFVGIGSKFEPGTGERMASLRSALGNVDRSLEAYRKIQDVTGKLRCLIMKAALARMMGDEGTAAQADELYLQILEESEKEMQERL